MKSTMLPAEAIAALPVERLGRAEGVMHTVLWRDGISMAGVMTVAAGAHMGRHTHRAHHHHVWVLDGRATILGAELGPGSYAHIPAGVEHDIDATDTGGCSLLYVYQANPREQDGGDGHGTTG